jgi:hypothetical protein
VFRLSLDLSEALYLHLLLRHDTACTPPPSEAVSALAALDAEGQRLVDRGDLNEWTTAEGARIRGQTNSKEGR